MKIVKIALFLFLIFSINSCERSPQDKENSDPPEEIMNSAIRDVEPESSVNDQATDSTVNGIETKSATSEINTTDQPPMQDATKTEVGDKFIIPNEILEVVVLASIVFNLLLLGLFFMLFRKNTRLHNDIDTKNEKLNNKNWRIKELERDLQVFQKPKEGKFQPTNRENIVNERGQRIDANKRKEISSTQHQSSTINEKPIEVDLNPKITSFPPPPEKTPKVTLYAGKPSEAKTFTAISSQQDEHKSIFRLTLENREADRAQFEVVENEYIMKMIANSPDTYLYNACNPENSNQNFDGRILTTKKGIASLVDGEWRVNDEDKATIKFQ